MAGLASAAPDETRLQHIDNVRWIESAAEQGLELSGTALKGLQHNRGLQVVVTQECLGPLGTGWKRFVFDAAIEGSSGRVAPVGDCTVPGREE